MSTPTMQIQPAGTVRMERAVRKFHMSLNVSDLTHSIAFYTELFGVAPAKVYADYAKFELAEPPVVLALVPRTPVPGANLNHAGIRVLDARELVDAQRRLEQAGFPTRREDGVECCYALQTKFWATDPDGLQWEIYVFHEDLDHHGSRQPPGATVDTAPASIVDAGGGLGPPEGGPHTDSAPPEGGPHI